MNKNERKFSKNCLGPSNRAAVFCELQRIILPWLWPYLCTAYESVFGRAVVHDYLAGTVKDTRRNGAFLAVLDWHVPRLNTRRAREVPALHASARTTKRWVNIYGALARSVQAEFLHGHELQYYFATSADKYACVCLPESNQLASVLYRRNRCRGEQRAVETALQHSEAVLVGSHVLELLREVENDLTASAELCAGARAFLPCVKALITEWTEKVRPAIEANNAQPLGQRFDVVIDVAALFLGHAQKFYNDLDTELGRRGSLGAAGDSLQHFRKYLPRLERVLKLVTLRGIVPQLQASLDELRDMEAAIHQEYLAACAGLRPKIAQFFPDDETVYGSVLHQWPPPSLTDLYKCVEKGIDTEDLTHRYAALQGACFLRFVSQLGGFNKPPTNLLEERQYDGHLEQLLTLARSAKLLCTSRADAIRNSFEAKQALQQIRVNNQALQQEVAHLSSENARLRAGPAQGAGGDNDDDDEGEMEFSFDIFDAADPN